jgi:hypothetical protein
MESKMSFEVVFDPDTIHRSKSGNVTSTFYVLLDGEPFPEADWNDFTETLFAELVSVIARVSSSQSGTETEFHFVDGPLRLTFRKVKNYVDIVGTHDAGHVGPVTARCTLNEVTDSVNSSLRAFKRALHSYDSSSD